MTNERSLKYIALSDFFRALPLEELTHSTYMVNGKVYAVDKMLKDFNELRDEFLEEYTIDTPSREG